MTFKRIIKISKIAVTVLLTMFLVTGYSNPQSDNAVYNPDAYVAKNVQDYQGAPGTSAIDFYPKYPKLIIKPGMNKKLIAKGEYLVKAGDCMACHTDTTHHGLPFAGGLAIDTPFGKFFTPNITPDKETGIGNWDDEDFIRAMHDGIRPDGSYYFPVFPYTSFNKVSKSDLLAIKAYLDALPPIHKEDKSPTAPWPFSWRFAQVFWRALFFKAAYYQYDPNESEQWNRGAYLVQGLGHCGECHTPRNIMGAMKEKYYLTGAFIDGFWAPDITSLGLSTASDKQVTQVFEDYELINQAGPVRGPMAEVDHDSLKYLTQDDLNAIAVYLKSVHSQQPRIPDISKQEALDLKPLTAPSLKQYKFTPDTLKVGEKVYNKVCAICHDKGMAGAPKIYDTANWTMRLKQGLPMLYKHAIDGFNQMPPKGGCITCSDNEIEAAVDYIIDNSQVPAEKNIVSGDEALKPDTSITLGKKVYEKVCSVCHDNGHLGAQKLGDPTLLSKTVDVLIYNTIHGIGNMPAKGGCKTCSNSDIIAAVKYMAQQANPKGDYSLW